MLGEIRIEIPEGGEGEMMAGEKMKGDEKRGQIKEKSNVSDPVSFRPDFKKNGSGSRIRIYQNSWINFIGMCGCHVSIHK